MIQCAKCGNDTRTSNLVTAQGEVMVAGTIGTESQPIIAQVCTACGYIELYAPQPVSRSETVQRRKQLEPLGESIPEAPIPTA